VSIQSKAERIKLILFDIDGVLTDGVVIVHADGSESKNFAIRDGIAMIWAQRSGVRVGFLSARNSPTTPHRAAQLGITLIYQGVLNKLASYEQILADLALSDEQVAYMGDDIVDLAVLKRVGLSSAPSDAVEEVRTRVDVVTTTAGGRGAGRELIELVMKAQNAWDPIVNTYLNEPHAVPTEK
jgi:3-deoxy-D-manno-octulosonate 8-phosphate phosphatase (KDO 8-P phosphatase)